MVRGKSTLPTIFITWFHNNELLKFRYNQKVISEKRIKEFIDDFRNRRIKPFYMSEEPEEADAGEED
jgi:hypothetical protein